MSFVNPAPEGSEGRTDEGVDWGSIHGSVVAVAQGYISNIYYGLRGFGTTIIEHLNSGEDIYYALETGADPSAQLGQRVQAGQAVARGRGSGGIEVGFWDSSTGRAVGAPGYREGAVTSAGQRFRSMIGNGTGTASQSLTQLWIQAGGSPGLANLMAAIALAESGGQVDATGKNSNGTTDYGIWQINSSHNQYDPQRLLSDPLYNAQAAVAIERTEGLTAWATYTSGAYRTYMSQAGGATVGGGIGGLGGGIVRPGGGGPPSADISADYYKMLGINRKAPPGAGTPVSTGLDVSFWDTLTSPFQFIWHNFTHSWENFYKDVTGPADALVTTGEETAQFAAAGVKFLENLPWYFLRGVELIVGIALMWVGLRSNFNLSRRSPLADTGLGIRRVTRQLAADTPVGRAQREARGRRAGRHEGETEGARLEARRKARADYDRRQRAKEAVENG